MPARRLEVFAPNPAHPFSGWGRASLSADGRIEIPHHEARTCSTALFNVGFPVKRPGILGRCFGVMVNPGAVLVRSAEELGLAGALGIPALAFALFFLQTALDLDRSGVLGPFVGGAMIGALGVPLLALLVWVVTRPLGGTETLAWTVRAFGLAYAPALVYGVCGLAANVILGWHTALAFGVTGVLWTISPLFTALRRMTGERRRLSMILATMVGLVVLLAWSTLVGA